GIVQHVLARTDLTLNGAEQADRRGDGRQRNQRIPVGRGIGDRGSDGLRRVGIQSEYASDTATVGTDREGRCPLQIESRTGRVELGMYAERSHSAVDLADRLGERGSVRQTDGGVVA